MELDLQADDIGSDFASGIVRGSEGRIIPRLDERFGTSTRGRLILLLRRESRTVNELAEALALTDNAVRAHLTALERDGLVRQSGSRPGRRKPNVIYDLTAKAEHLFPKVYGLILSHLLDVLKERVSARKLDEMVCAVGHRLAPGYRPGVRAGRPQDRIDQAIAVLRELGGFCERITEDGKAVLRCFDCPVAVAVVGHPEVCRLVETVLADVLGVPVHQRCQTGPSPQCYFEIETGAG
jgi:predicted ArsR family transcriptional regulator